MAGQEMDFSVASIPTKMAFPLRVCPAQSGVVAETTVLISPTADRKIMTMTNWETSVIQMTIKIQYMILWYGEWSLYF